MEFTKTKEFARMMEHEVDGSKMFGKKTYDDAFWQLFDGYKAIMQEYVNFCETLEGEALERTREQVGSAFIACEEARLARTPARQRKVRLYDDNLYMALFVIPAVGQFKNPHTDALADGLVKLWRQQYPQHPINRGNYDQISNGFKKRRFCYITTAVCESLGKGDDCRELNCLREYRDHWLMLVENGPALVDEYYMRAPKVVKAIDCRPDRHKVYKDIYQEYIRPCISLIREGRYEDCKNKYISMVTDLENCYCRDESYIKH